MIAQGVINHPNQYDEAERLTCELAEAFARGEGESALAEDLRERLFQTWSHLSPPAQHRLQRLSAELDMLSGDEVPRPRILPRHSKKSTRAQSKSVASVAEAKFKETLRRAFDNHQWELALEKLRENPALFTLDQRALFRATAYRNLGRFAVSILFSRWSLRNNPKDWAHRISLVHALKGAKRYAELR